MGHIMSVRSNSIARPGTHLWTQNPLESGFQFVVVRVRRGKKRLPPLCGVDLDGNWSFGLWCGFKFGQCVLRSHCSSAPRYGSQQTLSITWCTVSYIGLWQPFIRFVSKVGLLSARDDMPYYVHLLFIFLCSTNGGYSSPLNVCWAWFA